MLELRGKDLDRIGLRRREVSHAEQDSVQKKRDGAHDGRGLDDPPEQAVVVLAVLGVNRSGVRVCSFMSGLLIKV